MIGQLLDGRYQVIRTLRGGGFGQTYIAQDTRRPGNPACVVKHLKPATSDPKFLQTARRLFQTEAESLEQLGSHGQIPRLLAFFEQNQEFFLVQEFIDGQPLTLELPEGQRWAEAQVIQMLKEVLGILVFVHGHGVIHRDIKPDNLIRRRSDQRLVLLDFGAVKQIRTQLIMAGQGQISATVAIGTPGYMPTEQGQGKPRPNSDIYALGMIGIQALTGIYPHQLQEDLETGELIWQHLVSVSPGLIAVLEKMTRYHFKDRYQSAVETLQAIEQLGSSPQASSVQSPTKIDAPTPPRNDFSSPADLSLSSTSPSIAAASNPAVAANPASATPSSGQVPQTAIQPASAPARAAVPIAASQASFTPIPSGSNSRKLPVIIPLMIGCGAFAVVGFIGLIVLAIIFPAFLGEAGNARQAEAKNYIGSLNRAQQAYHIENGQFSFDMSALGVGVPAETENYSYQIYLYDSDPIAMQVAIPRQPELNSYVGLVWTENLDSSPTVVTRSLLCESDMPSQAEPSDPNIVDGATGLELDCPPGFSPLF
ncbi:MAG: hypothetical protein Kow00121_60750 [Elainellaceae cyanobacterium]